MMTHMAHDWIGWDEIAQRKRRPIDGALRYMLNGAGYALLAKCVPACACAPGIGEWHAYDAILVPAERWTRSLLTDIYSTPICRVSEVFMWICALAHQVRVGDLHVIERCRLSHVRYVGATARGSDDCWRLRL